MVVVCVVLDLIVCERCFLFLLLLIISSYFEFFLVVSFVGKTLRLNLFIVSNIRLKSGLSKRLMDVQECETKSLNLGVFVGYFDLNTLVCFYFGRKVILPEVRIKGEKSLKLIKLTLNNLALTFTKFI